MSIYKKLLSSSLVLAGLVLSGCSKYLDHPVENLAPETTIDYTNLSLMYQPVSGAYKAVTRGGFAFWVPTFLKASQSDDIIPETGYSEVNTLINNGVSGSAVASFWALETMWDNYYSPIISCNGALSELAKFGANIPSGDAADQQLLLRYQAEARFLIALGHFYLCRSWGNIPILGPSSIYPTALDTVHITPMASVRQYILNEMNFCIPNLEDVAPNQATHIGGVTKYTALMLKAKTAMDIAGSDNSSPYWDTVLDCTNQIISSGKFSLFPDYYELWKKPGKLCNESILEFQYSDFGSTTGNIVTSGDDANGSQWANLFLFQAPNNSYGGLINGPGWLVPSDNAYNFLVGRNDAIRIKTTFERCGINGNPSTYAVTPDGDTVSGNVAGAKYFNGKAYYPTSESNGTTGYYGSNDNVRVWRYAETLLMNAEALIRKGQNGDAPLNLVRNRVGLPSLTNATLQQLMDERRAELICEWWGERFNDLVRTGQAASVFSGFVKGQSEFWPIPTNQIALDKNLQ
ncbi:MAG TPA: RagB/SusD family nutrient uptake outer membrane protein [Puia sp.]|nr:RagB/SusD family nutrient uptake outer membrane protein [Puia sp.]